MIIGRFLIGHKHSVAWLVPVEQILPDDGVVSALVMLIYGKCSLLTVITVIWDLGLRNL